MQSRTGRVVWLALLSASACAQISKPGTGTVTGHVICQDTQKPARFAQVVLYGVPSSVTSTPKIEGMDSRAAGATFRSMMEAQNSATMVQAQTGFDGSFVAADLPPGDYYALAAVPGYVQPRSLVQAAYDAGEDLTKGITGVSIVHVSADRSAQTEITVMRGAAVEGRVLWDDGSPVNGAIVSVESTAKEHKALPPQFGMIMGFSTSPFTMQGATDDHGRYRISGLAAGEYRVKATLPTNTHMTFSRGRLVGLSQIGTLPVIVFAPAAFHQVDAKPVKLTAGEEQTDQDITYNLAGLHTVSGTITSTEDHHPLNSGSVTLIDETDKTFRRSAGLESDGSFHVTFVPSGTYTMTVTNAADTVPEDPEKIETAQTVIQGTRTVRRYEKAEQPVMVADSDLSGQNVELKPENVQPDAGEDGGK
jgi:hypothetical protein